jgi:DNA-binding Lrp family transcriptional regulator
MEIPGQISAEIDSAQTARGVQPDFEGFSGEKLLNALNLEPFDSVQLGRAFRMKLIEKGYILPHVADAAPARAPMLVITTKDMEDYELFTRRFFYENPDIKNFKTLVVMDRVKVGFALPFDPDDGC